MGLIQKLLLAVLPASAAKAMEAESREWICTCPCGHARSIWDLGGVRWGAAGNPRRLLRCPKCGDFTLHVISKKPAAGG